MIALRTVSIISHNVSRFVGHMINHLSNGTRKVFLYSVGVVSPEASNLTEFIQVIKSGKSALTPHRSFYNFFLKGEPKFDFSIYKNWFHERYGPKRFSLLNDKGSDLVKYALGTTIDALEMVPGLEKAIQKCDPKVTMISATGLADLPSILSSHKSYRFAREKWNSFWACKDRNIELKKYLAGDHSFIPPQNPQEFLVDSFERTEALQAWNEFWCVHSSAMNEFLRQLETIESVGIQEEDIENAKLSVIRNKIKLRKELFEKYKNPPPPWEGVSPNMLWNIPNLAASQISMNLNLHGNAYAVSGACASFGLALDHALLEIQSGRSDVVIASCVDASPSDEIISAFYNGKLAVFGNKQGIPFTDLRGTHISGGACTWILSTPDVMEPLGILPHLNVEILSSRISSDAEHVITPSKEGPKLAIRQAFHDAKVTPPEIDLWDMHATGTPGDINELYLIDEFIHKDTIISARKGLIGHAMGASGALEMTALLYGMSCVSKNDGHEVTIPPVGIPKELVHPLISKMNKKIVFDEAVTLKTKKNALFIGKLNMGAGGISGCCIIKYYLTPPVK